MTKKILVAVIAIAFFVSCFVVYERHRAEQSINHVEIAIDMNDFQDLSGEAGISFEDTAKRMKNSGATSIGVQEVTLKEFEDRGYISYMPLGEFLYNFSYKNISENISEDFLQRIDEIIKAKGTNGRDLSYINIIYTPNRDVCDFLENSLSKRMKIDTINENGQNVIITYRKFKNMEQIGLGFWEKDFEYAKSLNFMNVIPRMQNYPGISKEEIDAKIAQIKSFGAKTVVFAGETVLGYKSDDSEDQEIIKYAGKAFADNGLVSAIIEKPAEEDVNRGQRGIVAFSRESRYSSTKVFSVEFEKTKKYDPKEIVNQWARAISERNARIIYVKTIWNPDKDALQNLEDTSRAVMTISKRISAMGLYLKNVNGLGDISPKAIQRFAISMGIAAGAILLLFAFFEMKEYIVYGLLGFGAFGACAVLFSPVLYNIFGNICIKIGALVCAIVFPSLAGWYLISLSKKFSNQEKDFSLRTIIFQGTMALIIAVIIALVGGIMIAAFFAESRYMLKLDIFRGVKIAFIFPILAFLIMYIKHIGIYVDKDGALPVMLQIKKLLNTSVTIKYALLGVIALGIVGIILIRSGNASAGLSSVIELKFRAFLENVLIARPRSKELLAFPALMFLVYFYVKNYKPFAFLSLFAGVIGLIDIVNSFSHIRMAVKIAGLSTGYSVLFGIIAGIILILLWVFVEKRFFSKMIARRETY